MNEMQVFETADFGSIRAVSIDGMPYFSGKDVAAALGYTNPQKAVRDHIDEEDKTVNDLFSVNGTPLTLINESGLYSLILSSKLPSAKHFKRWVTSEVLPMIRRTGVYAAGIALADGDSATPMRTLTPDDYIAAARLIASCKSDRLKIIINLLAKGGWDVTEANNSLVSGVSTADISNRIKTAMQDHNITFSELSAKTGISAEVLRSYRDGRRFPKPDRYTALVNTLETL